MGSRKGEEVVVGQDDGCQLEGVVEAHRTRGLSGIEIFGSGFEFVTLECEAASV